MLYNNILNFNIISNRYIYYISQFEFAIMCGKIYKLYKNLNMVDIVLQIKVFKEIV